MKMFTKLIGLMMMLLLMSAIVVGQSQQISNTIADKQTTEGILTDQMAGPLASAFEQKSIEGTDAVSGWVLGSGANGYSQNSRAANNYWKYQRTVYLLTAAEVAAAGITTGELLNSIGWWNLYAGNGTLAGDLNVYILNTADVAFNPSYTTWTNVTGAFTQVSALTSWTVPVEEGPWNVPFTSGTYNYTGGGLYIAWQFESPAGTVGTYPIAHYTYSLVSGLLYGTRSQTSTYPAMAGSGFRPITYLSSYTTVADIVKVTNIYAVEINAHPYAVPSPIKVQVFNVSGSTVSFSVTLTGTDGYNATQNVTNLAANTGFTISTFPNWSPTVDGDYTFTATTSVIAGEGFVDNNTYLIDVNVNTNQVSYSYYLQPYAYGWVYPGTGIFAEKHHMTGSGLVTGAVLGIANNAASTNNTVYGVLLDAAGTILATSPAHVITTINTAVIVNFSAPILITDADYYIGMLTTQGTVQWNPMMSVTETPNRPDGFFTFPAAGGTPVPSTWRHLLGAVVAPYVPCSPPTNLFASNITGTNTTLNWTSGSGTSQVEWGVTGFTPTGVGTPAASGLVIPTAPNTGYDFYVRDVCSGPIYSPWVLKTFWTFCEDCPGGAIAEGEPQLPDGDTGAGINGGCAVGDPLLTITLPNGGTVCGQSNTFTNNVGGASRDNDYYYVDLTSPSCLYWHVVATIKGNGLYNMTLFNAGNLDCAIGAYGTVTTTAGCQTGTVEVDVPSGHYYLVGRVAVSAGNLWPYGSGPWQYVMSITATPVGAPNLDPDPPASITVTVPPGGSTTQNLTIGNIGNYALDYAASTTGTFLPYFEDKFDTYVSGVQLAQQVGDLTKWTTWSNLPGSTEDPFVSSTVTYSGANSVMIYADPSPAPIGYSNDCVHPFPNYTSGSYKISFQMNVASGFVGYFNTLQLFSGAASQWGMQAYFELGGNASVDAGGAAAATWPFTYDTWHLNEIYVDLDGDYAQYYFDGNFIVDWTWSTGAFGNDNLKQLGGNNFFGYTGAGATDFCKYYLDDYKFEIAGNDWLTIDGGLGLSGNVAIGGPAVNLTVGFNAGTKPVGTYTKTINMATNELCGAGGTYAINVTMHVGYALTGNVNYGEVVPPTKPMATNTTVTITPAPVGVTLPVSTGPLGAYDIRPLDNGSYKLTGATTKAWGGLTTFDATLILRYLGSVTTFTNLQKRAADVNLSGTITSFDVTLVKRRLGGGNWSAWIAPNYVFDGAFPTTPPLDGLVITVNNANVTQVLRTLCSGDINGSYTPPAE